MFESVDKFYRYFYLDKNLNTKDKSIFFDKKILLDSLNLNAKGGRGSAFAYSYENKDFVYREYLRGGFLGKFIKKHFFKYSKYAHRAKDELLLLDFMLKNNINVPKPYIARESLGLFFIKQEIVIYKIDAINLCEYLKSNDFTIDLCSLITKELVKLFKLGIYHSDLNIKNILVANDRVYIIDFDKCYRKDLVKIDIENMLNRLLRSFEKEQKNDNICFNKDIFFKFKSMIFLNL